MDISIPTQRDCERTHGSGDFIEVYTFRCSPTKKLFCLKKFVFNGKYCFFCQNNLKICKYLGEAEAFTSGVPSSFTVSGAWGQGKNESDDLSTICTV